MPDYSQKHPKITTLPLLTEQSELLDVLIHASRWKKPMLVIPSLATEFNLPETRQRTEPPPVRAWSHLLRTPSEPAIMWL